MRIGYLYNFRAYPPKGGNHVHALELTQGFIREGHDVSVIDDPTMPGVTNYVGQKENLVEFVNSIDVLYIRIDARFTQQWEIMSECINLADDRPIVWEINSPSNEVMAYSWLGGKSVSGPESFLRILKRRLHAASYIIDVRREEKYRRSLAKHVSTAICVSKLLSNYASDELKIDDVVVLPNGGPLISKEEIVQRKRKRKDESFTVLYSGSAMYPWQGLDYLSQVIKLAEKEEPDILFVLAVNQITEDLPRSSNVKILEHLDREQILDAICCADACVSLHPEYPWSKYNFHNSPMKLFEYMACMAPSISSNHGQMRDLIEDGVNGLLCENNPKHILEKIKFLRGNPEQAKIIGQNGWEAIQSKFSWQNNVNKTLEIFQRNLTSK